MSDSGYIDQYELHMRKGRFRINKDTLRDPEIINALLGLRAVIVRAEFLYLTEQFEYTALSPDFDKVPDGQESPWYYVIADDDDDGIVNIRFEREG